MSGLVLSPPALMRRTYCGQAEHAMPVGAADIGGGHQFRAFAEICLRNADRAIGGGE